MQNLVFLHGWGQDKNTLESLASQLPGQKIFFDLPGFGETELPKRAWGVADYANYVKQNFLQEKSIIIGYSFGGRVAIKLAANYPELVEKIVLIASAGLRKKISLKRIWRKIIKKSSGDYQRAGVLKPIFSKIVCEDLSKDCKQVKQEVLILAAENDTEAPVWVAKKMRRLLKNSKLIILPNLDHWSILDLGLSKVVSEIKCFI